MLGVALTEQLQVVRGQQRCRLPGVFVQAPLGCALALRCRSQRARTARLAASSDSALLPCLPGSSPLCSPSSSTTWSGACGTAGSWRATSPSTRSAALFAGAIACCAAACSMGPLDPGGRPHRQPGQLSSRLLSVVAAGAVPCQAAGGLFHARFLCLCSQSCSNGLSCNCCHLLQVLEWFRAKGLEAYSISCGQSLLYNNIFPKHKVSEQQALLF